MVVTDDIASAPAERIDERRGIVGDVTVFKIAGAAAIGSLSRRSAAPCPQGRPSGCVRWAWCSEVHAAGGV